MQELPIKETTCLRADANSANKARNDLLILQTIGGGGKAQSLKRCLPALTELNGAGAVRFLSGLSQNQEN